MISVLKPFDRLKNALSRAPIIKPPIWDTTFDLICEASDDVVGVTLGQHIGRRFNIIHHASRTLNSAQKNHKPRLICWILLLQEFELQILHR